jgi:hypothetical protein
MTMKSSTEISTSGRPQLSGVGVRDNKSLRERLIGGWIVESFVETDFEKGVESYPFGRSPLGSVVYTASGLMSAQLQAEVRNSFKSGDVFGGEPQEYVAAGRSYLAYAGEYSVDEATSRVFHDVKVSFFPNWIGIRQVRIIDFEGDRMRFSFEKPIRSNGTLKSSVVTWKRFTD